MDKKNIVKIISTSAISAIPWIGGPLANIINETLNSSWQKRREAFEQEIKSKFENLDESFDRKIIETKNFASLLISINKDALSDVEDKVKLYANALINAIKNEDIGETKIHIFLNMLRDFSLAHIDMLYRLSKDIPRQSHSYLQQTIREKQRTAKEITIEEYFSDFEQIELIQKIIEDLYQNGLIDSNKFLDGNNVAAALGGTSHLTKKTTKLGDDLLNFITDNE